MRSASTPTLVLAATLSLASAWVCAAGPDPHTGAALPNAVEYAERVLPVRQGFVSWRTLSNVKPSFEGARIVPVFSQEVLNLDKRDVHVQGFMIPVETTRRHKHFLLSAVPPSCPFCLPAGPEALIEVRTTAEVDFDHKPIALAGKLAVRDNDPRGIFYILTDAAPVPEQSEAKN